MKQNRFKYYNPSPLYNEKRKLKNWNRGDCAVRAVCGATGISWSVVYRLMSDFAYTVYEPFNCPTGFDECMKTFGFVKHSYKRGEKRETVTEFAENHNDEISILNLSHHYVCCKNGEYHDVWDCGDKTAYSYYTLDKEKFNEFKIRFNNVLKYENSCI